jgi:NTE family protein
LREAFTNFELLLKQHFDFDELEAWGPRTSGPVLAMGAVNILSGKLAVYNSRTAPIRNEFIRASCAVPNLFPAVEYDGQAYWDGLFSDNPPIVELAQVAFVGEENLPDELWVIKINRTGCDKIPRTTEEIIDRRNELIGNVSLFQQLDTLAWRNDLLLMGVFKEEILKRLDIRAPIKMPHSFVGSPVREYHIPYLEMSESLQSTLDYESKLDRGPENLLPMIADGEKQAAAFLAERIAAQ